MSRIRHKPSGPAAGMQEPILRIGTRKSQLALWQTRHVAAQLEAAWPGLQCELHEMSTQGDQRIDRPLPEIGGKGLFTAELEAALHDSRIDLAVHSLKDLPVENAPGLTLGAVLSRADVRDVLVARPNDDDPWTLAKLPHGAVVGTSSLRRQAQLLAHRPDLAVRPIRGNVETRLRKVFDGDYHAAVMAGAGIIRLELADHITQWLEPTVMVPAPGQGALAVQCRENDERVLDLLAPLEDPAVRLAVSAERGLLWQLGGGCSAPIGAYATVAPDGAIRMIATVAAPDGSRIFHAEATGSDSAQVAIAASDDLMHQGADTVLQAIRQASQNSATRETSAPTHAPLKDKRIAITRPAAQADEFTALVQEAGAVPVVVPLIEIVPIRENESLQAALDNLAQYDWILFTSANAVRIFAGQMGGASAVESRTSPLPRIAAVGPATADTLRLYSLLCDAMPSDYTGADLAGALGNIQGAHILLPRSARGSSELPEALKELGSTVDDVGIYTTVPAASMAADMQVLLTGVDAITLTSGSTVRAFVQALPEEVAADPAGIRLASCVACIGPSTAEVARELKLHVDVVATEHTMAGLMSALSAYFGS